MMLSAYILLMILCMYLTGGKRDHYSSTTGYYIWFGMFCVSQYSTTSVLAPLVFQH